MSNRLTIPQMWKLIYKAKWVKDPNFYRVRKELSNKLTQSQFTQLGKFVNTKVKRLDKIFRKDWLGDPGIHVSDDGWSDLRAEVVGRGERFYNMITADKLRKMANTWNYTENFEYTFQEYDPLTIIPPKRKNPKVVPKKTVKKRRTTKNNKKTQPKKTPTKKNTKTKKVTTARRRKTRKDKGNRRGSYRRRKTTATKQTDVKKRTRRKSKTESLSDCISRFRKTKKYERCVMKIKSQNKKNGTKYNPWAICTNSLKKTHC